MSLAATIPTSRAEHWWRERVASAVASALAFFCVAIAAAIPVLAFYPGLMNADSLTLYAGALLPAPVMDWHSPFLTWMLRLLIAAGGGVAALVTVQSAIYVFSFYGVLAATRSRIATRLVVLALVLVAPPVMPWLAAAEKTSFMSVILGACFLCSLRLESGGGPRILPLICLIGLAAVGTWCRPNGLIIFLPLVLYTAIQARRSGRRKIVAAAFVIGFLLLGLGAPALAVRLGAIVPSYPQQATMDLDLLNLSRRTGQDLLPPNIPAAPVAQVKAAMAPDPFALWRVDTSLRRITDAADMHRLQAAWLAAIREHPLTYLQYRFDLYEKYLCFDLSAICPDSWHWYTGGIDANPFGLVSRHFAPAFNFYKALAGSVAFHPFFPLFGAFAVLVGAVLTRHPVPGVYAAILLLYEASNMLLIPGVSVRMAIPLGLMLPFLITGLYTPGARPRWGNVVRATAR
jgi:hypothetical protein